MTEVDKSNLIDLVKLKENITVNEFSRLLFKNSPMYM